MLELIGWILFVGVRARHSSLMVLLFGTYFGRPKPVQLGGAVFFKARKRQKVMATSGLSLG